jgi:photosystem II stability/assembly factor-like uncharacterized protein
MLRSYAVWALAGLVALPADFSLPPPQATGTKASLRGLSAIDDRVVWASGTGGTVMRTVDGGAHWSLISVPDASKLDFRDIEAFDRDSAIIMSSGPGNASRVYRTEDGGKTWKMAFENPDSSGFFDAIAFWNRKDGLLLGDPVDGRFALFRTSDGGRSWNRLIGLPAANSGEGAFAASGTALSVGPRWRAWFATGGVRGARVFRTSDGGRSWLAAQTPLRHDAESAGIFSLAFAHDGLHGIVVGGDYRKPDDATATAASTIDGGVTWTLSAAPPSGYRSGMCLYDRTHAFAAGPSGADTSSDSGATWTYVGGPGYHACAVAGHQIWFSGSDGKITSLQIGALSH